jgi:hypothetical protein
MKGGDIKMWDNYQFILRVRALHFRYVSKIVSILEDLARRYNLRTCRNSRGILGASRKFCRKNLGCDGLLIRCHSILWPPVSQMRVSFHVLWQHLHASYPSQARELVDSNLAVAREVLGVVDELLMKPVNFYVDDPSRLINGGSN